VKLTDDQREQLHGLLLAGAEPVSNDGGKTYSIVLEDIAVETVAALQSSFGEWVDPGSPPSSFRTIANSSFRFYAQQYCTDEGRRIPKLIHRWLTPQVLAIWFISAGARTVHDRPTLPVRTDVASDAERLMIVLNETFDVTSKARGDHGDIELLVSESSVQTFLDVITRFLHSDA
jgi:hypothetical protein